MPTERPSIPTAATTTTPTIPDLISTAGNNLLVWQLFVELSRITSFGEREAALSERMAAYASVPLTATDIPEKFWLLNDVTAEEDPYERAIAELRRMGQLLSPVGKVGTPDIS